MSYDPNSTSTAIPVGKLGDEYLTFRGERSIVLAAPTRGWKDRAIVKPTLLSYGDSCVVLDVKGDLFLETSGFRAKSGQKVFVWAPFAEDGRTHCSNPLSYIRVEYRYVVADINTLAHIVYPSSPGDSATTIFFNDQTRNLFLGLVLYLIETPELPRTIGEVLRQSSGKGKSTHDHLAGIIKARQAGSRPLSDACVDALNRFITNDSDNVRSGIVSSLNGPLTVFTEPLVDAATSRDDFSWEDLRRKRMTVYLIVPPPRLDDATVPLRIMYALIIKLNTRVHPSEDPTLRYQALMVNNEFTAPGRIGIFPKAIGYFSGYGLRALTVVQATSQLRSTYGEEDANTIIANHGMQILFTPLLQQQANEYSEMMGTFTARAQSKGRSHSTGRGGGGSSHSTNESDQRRALLMPQEFKELPMTKCVIQVEYSKPMLVDKNCYDLDPTFSSRLLPPIILPMIDLDLYRAKVEGRVRQAADDETFSVEQIAADLSRLPKVAEDAGAAEVSAYVATFFGLLAGPLPIRPEPEPASEETEESEQGENACVLVSLH